MRSEGENNKRPETERGGGESGNMDDGKDEKLFLWMMGNKNKRLGAHARVEVAVEEMGEDCGQSARVESRAGR